jgi:hypothetical protein
MTEPLKRLVAHVEEGKEDARGIANTRRGEGRRGKWIDLNRCEMTCLGMDPFGSQPHTVGL